MLTSFSHPKTLSQNYHLKSLKSVNLKVLLPEQFLDRKITSLMCKDKNFVVCKLRWIKINFYPFHSSGRGHEQSSVWKLMEYLGLELPDGIFH